MVRTGVLDLFREFLLRVFYLCFFSCASATTSDRSVPFVLLWDLLSGHYLELLSVVVWGVESGEVREEAGRGEGGEGKGRGRQRVVHTLSRNFHTFQTPCRQYRYVSRMPRTKNEHVNHRKKILTSAPASTTIPGYKLRVRVLGLVFRL